MTSAVRVLCDVDGVLADFVGALFATVDARLTLADVTTWDVFALLTEGQRTTAKMALQDPAWWLALKPVPGALDALAAVASAPGVEVVYATSPWVSCRGWEWARRRWLQEHAGAKHGQVVVTSRKDVVSGDVFLDDHPERWARLRAGSPGGGDDAAG